MTLSTIEDQIKSDWNWFYASIALHPHIWLVAALLVGGLIGHLI